MPRHQAGRPVLPWHTTRPYVTAPHSHIPRHHTFPATHRLMPPHACFSTAWTSDSLKFTVAAQEGALAIWGVRSSVPVWVFWAGLRGPSGSRGRMRRRAAPAGWGTNAWAIHDRTHVFTFVKRPINKRKEFPFVTWQCALIEPLLVRCELDRWDDQSCSSLSSFLHGFVSTCILDS
ncbi:hypothetical protein JB92DRAFT_2907642 [Gautieria morchelliformis]|nr:hypothetical protein JB92DRAFT_2907642 [Gautieria morchelliformis]